MTDRPDPPARVPGQGFPAMAGRHGAIDGAVHLDVVQMPVPVPAGRDRTADLPGADLPGAHGQASGEPGIAQRHPADALPHHAQRMQALGYMTAGVAHEFNNLMTIVLANLQRLAQEQDPERRAGQVARADWGAQRAARLTGQMLSFSRRGLDEPQVVDINATMRDCDAILDQMAGHQLSVVLELADGPLPARLDPAQLELVLLNLVRNAADASPPGGRIVVRSRRCRFGGMDAVGMAVVDDGIGMTDQVKAQATQSFFTTKQPGRGTGLGLSMVRDFAEHHGGRLEICSAPGQGTTIDLVLPMATTDVETPLPA